jgi:hypothetical protein
MSPGRTKKTTNSLKQKAVYWGGPASDGATGRTFDAAVEISVRWEERNELFVDSTGQERTSRAIILVPQDVDLGGYLYLGTLVSLDSSEEADPFELDDAHEILQFSKVPDRSGTVFVRTVWL